MNSEQLQRMKQDKGFIAALDQSGGSTPKALERYGIPPDGYSGEAEMYQLVHEMRSRIMLSPAFSPEYILGAILFADTMRREVDGLPTPDFLWKRKKIVTFLKVDEGLLPERDGVQLMKPIPGLPELLREAVDRRVFGTKMRSFIRHVGPDGPAAIVEAVRQQFELAEQIAAAGLVPIIEPEVDIYCPKRGEAEAVLRRELEKSLAALAPERRVMLKLSLPLEDDFYRELIASPKVVRVVALSGGYSQEEAVERLARNHGMIASFSRALAQGLTVQQSDEWFNARLAESVKAIYKASIT